MKITNDIYYVGVNDHKVDLFEGQYRVPNGMAYNSYVIMDEKVAVMDTVDAHFTHEWLDNLQSVLGDRKPDYLIIQHMEPDHSANIANFAAAYPETVIVSNQKAFAMMENFFEIDLEARKLVVCNGDTLSLGKHQLTFVFAPMVHWPEVMVTYDSTDKLLFSADAFGAFGALSGHLFADEVNFERDWLDEARRYYTNIVGKYGTQVQALLKKLAGRDIRAICPLHGPVLTGARVDRALELYDLWSRYEPEERGVLVAYASIHGHTARAAMELTDLLARAGVKAEAFDLARRDWAEGVAQAFRYSALVLAASSYDAGVFTPMAQFLYRLKMKNFRGRAVGLVENGSWGPTALKSMQAALAELKDMTVVEPTVTIRSALDQDSRARLEELAAAMAAAV